MYRIFPATLPCLNVILPLRVIGLILLGLFCITSATRPNALATCTVYDPARLTAISACSDFGKPIKYRGHSDVRADFNGSRWSFVAGGHVDVWNEDRDYQYPYQYSAEV